MDRSESDLSKTQLLVGYPPKMSKWAPGIPKISLKGTTLNPVCSVFTANSGNCEECTPTGGFCPCSVMQFSLCHHIPSPSSLPPHPLNDPKDGSPVFHTLCDHVGLMLRDVDDALREFKQEMVLQRNWDNVVVMTASDFGRTLCAEFGIKIWTNKHILAQPSCLFQLSFQVCQCNSLMGGTLLLVVQRFGKPVMLFIGSVPTEKDVFPLYLAQWGAPVWPGCVDWLCASPWHRELDESHGLGAAMRMVGLAARMAMGAAVERLWAGLDVV
eukprot:gene23034-biopygen2803